MLFFHPSSFILHPFLSSDLTYLDFLRGELSGDLSGRAFVRDDEVDVGDRADEGRADVSELGVICDDDALACLAQHGAVHGCLVGIIGGQAVLGMNAVHAYEYLVDEHLADGGDGDGAGEREPVAAHRAARDDDFQIDAMAELHSDVDGVGEDCDSLAVTNAARDLCGGRARAEGHYIAVLYDLGGGQPDTTFLSRVLLFLRAEGRDVSERLVEHRLYADGPAVRAHEQPRVLQFGQLSSDGRG